MGGEDEGGEHEGRGREDGEGTWRGRGEWAATSPGWASHPLSALPVPWQPGILTLAVLTGTCRLGSLGRLNLNTNDLP